VFADSKPVVTVSGINIYCDESCHIEHDHQTVMVLGAVSCPLPEARRVAVDLRTIKSGHGHSPSFEAKWKKVSPAGLGLYRELVAYFLNEPTLRFRAVLVPDKNLLRHGAFGHDHDTWYYKMYFTLLDKLIKPGDTYAVYLDIKDARSGARAAKLHEVLCNSMRDPSCSVIRRVQPVRSHEVEQVQLADMLTGTVAYAARGLESSPAKTELVEQLRSGCRCSLTATTPLTATKFNLLRWVAAQP
jgi:hypothetical protein